MRTGDVVKHIPSGETWLVAWADERDVIAVGWPETTARVSDCYLVTAATDEEYWRLVEKLAERSRDDMRTLRCRAIVEEKNARECAAMMHL